MGTHPTKLPVLSPSLFCFPLRSRLITVFAFTSIPRNEPYNSHLFRRTHFTPANLSHSKALTQYIRPLTEGKALLDVAIRWSETGYLRAAAFPDLGGSGRISRLLVQWLLFSYSMVVSGEKTWNRVGPGEGFCDSHPSSLAQRRA